MENEQPNLQQTQAKNPTSSKDVYPGRTQAMAGIVCGLLSFFVVHFLFGVAGLTLGTVAHRKGAGKIATVAQVISALGIVTAFLLAAMSS